MFKFLTNIFKTDIPTETPEMQQIKLLNNLILQQQLEIKQLADRVVTLEIDMKYRLYMNEVDAMLLLQQMQLDKIQMLVECMNNK